MEKEEKVEKEEIVEEEEYEEQDAKRISHQLIID